MKSLFCRGRHSAVASKSAAPAPTPTSRSRCSISSRKGFSPWEGISPRPSRSQSRSSSLGCRSRRPSPTHTSQLARRRRRLATTAAFRFAHESDEEQEEEEYEPGDEEGVEAEVEEAESASTSSDGTFSESPFARRVSSTLPPSSSPPSGFTPPVWMSRSSLTPDASPSHRALRPLSPPPQPAGRVSSAAAPCLCLDRVHVPMLGVKDVGATLEQQCQQQVPPALFSPVTQRSLDSTPRPQDAAVGRRRDNNGGAATLGGAAGALDASLSAGQRSSVHYIPSAEKMKEVAAASGFTTVTARRHTPRFQQVGVRDRSVSLRRDSLTRLSDPTTDPPLPPSQDQYEEEEEEEEEGEKKVYCSNFVPLSFYPTRNADDAAAHHQRHSCATITDCAAVQPSTVRHNSTFASVSATSFPSPPSILLKSTTLLSHSSNGTTATPSLHPSWRSFSLQTGSRISDRGSRRGLGEKLPAGFSQERRRSSSLTPRFVENDATRRQLSRHDSDTSSSSSSNEDAHTIEMVRSALLRLHRRDSASRNLSGADLLSVMRERISNSPRRTEEQRRVSANPLHTSA